VEDGDNQGHGHKRRATDELERDQRLAKRFDLLNLGMYLAIFYHNNNNWLTHPQQTTPSSMYQYQHQLMINPPLAPMSRITS
jgi:hypothetical protein